MPELSGDISLAWRLVSLVGLLSLVSAYLLNQRGKWQPDSTAYLLFNVIGSALLAAYSTMIREWIFVALEGFWCVASMFALRRARAEASR